MEGKGTESTVPGTGCCRSRDSIGQVAENCTEVLGMRKCAAVRRKVAGSRIEHGDERNLCRRLGKYAYHHLLSAVR